MQLSPAEGQAVPGSMLSTLYLSLNPPRARCYITPMTDGETEAQRNGHSAAEDRKLNWGPSVLIITRPHLS